MDDEISKMGFSFLPEEWWTFSPLIAQIFFFLFFKGTKDNTKKIHLSSEVA